MDLGKIWNESGQDLEWICAQSVFPYEEFSEGNVNKRTKKSFELNTKKAINTGEPVEGVKGPSWLAGLHNYDKVNGTGIDYMHCVLLIKSNPILIKIFQKLTNC